MSEAFEIDNQVFPGFWRRVLMRLIDAAILAIPMVLLYRTAVSFITKHDTLMPFIGYSVLGMAFEVVMVSRFGGTPGKLLLKAKIVNAAGDKLSIWKSILRYILHIISAVLGILSLDAAYFHHVRGDFQSLNSIVGFVILGSCLTVVFNRQKRAAHDYWTGSYVISTKKEDFHYGPRESKLDHDRREEFT